MERWKGGRGVGEGKTEKFFEIRAWFHFVQCFQTKGLLNTHGKDKLIVIGNFELQGAVRNRNVC